MRKTRRRVPTEYMTDDLHSGICYSPERDGLYCAVCVVFNTSDIAFVRKPFMDWSNAKKAVGKHTRSKSHLIAQECASSFVSVCMNEQESVVECLSKSYKEKIERNRKILAAMISSTIL